MSELPGWFGKLPGMGDFAHRRLPDEFRNAWDRWLQLGLARLRVRHADWTERYLQSPVWCFVIGDGVIGGACWIGVLMPSVDGVGRYFPFTVAAPFDATQTELWGATLARARQWWRLAMEAALEGLESDLDATRFEAALTRRFAATADDASAESIDSMDSMDSIDALDDNGAAGLALPELGHSLWFTDPSGERGLGMASRGLPQDEQFDALFGFAPDAPTVPGALA